MENLGYKRMCLLKEAKNSIKLLEKGLSDLQKVNGEKDLDYATVILLSIGYERLIKCLLCLALMDDKGKFEEAPYETSRGKRHNLVYLFNRLLSVSSEKKYSSKFGTKKGDIDLLGNDKNLIKAIFLLSDFAQGWQYYNLDMVLKGTTSFEDATKEWKKITSIIFEIRKNLFKKMDDDGDQEAKGISIRILERFAKTLAGSVINFM